MTINKKAIALHKKFRGKIEMRSKVALATRGDLNLAYTPGVGAVCLEIAKDKNKSREYTNRANQVAIVSDGTAILGLGNIGPEAGMPVMEGKAAIFKEFAGVDAFPLCINADSADEVINFCKQIEPSFAGINLEDIAAPRCFEVLERLEKVLSIPVFHDDQDGTAIVTLAGLINACRASGRVLKEQKISISGSGAAGLAIARLLIAFGAKDICLIDSKGAVNKNRKDLNRYKLEILKKTKTSRRGTSKEECVRGSDVYIGVSRAGELSPEMIKSMNQHPIIFAMANPVPEILPAEAYEAGALIVATGRSDFDNQINNALVFPGIFRGLLDFGIKKVTTAMKISAAIALAYSVKKPKNNSIVPNITDKKVVKIIANAIRQK